MSHALPALQWDVFCRVIDNFGDIGVCWRLVAQLAGQGQRVRLWVDDASALAWMAPTGCPGVELRAWGSPPPGPHEPAPDVMVEAFGCEIAPEFIAYSTYQSSARGQNNPKPVWINLEYLSAEGYVERNHKLSSLLSSGPGAGRTRWFFYPGFTHNTGGLLREPDLMARREVFDRTAWRAAHTAAYGLSDGDSDGNAGQRWVSLFCYEPAALPELLHHAQAQPTQLLVTPGRPAAAVRAALGGNDIVLDKNGPQRLLDNREQLSISYLPHRPQPAFDEMLWACDLNMVRGEDSLVRALWAGQALVWHIYPQHDNAHHDKLWAFLDWLQAPASLRQFHATWNGLNATPLQWPSDDTLAEWAACIAAARARLLTQDNLVAQLLGFVAEKR
ncbi:elongation factor P maturation arginine rhamnosyltransferase EarP [Acidovorax sp.]|uniref:elongation factor P maturation arginine rhamnosyltransferase EarP n=1 Tax=Acidovorax sp. TaxID=1872122 RepID=UPI0026093133|nr:elongation factor P maturation arginine rhamnosyltransferase EarP [Acidovorax sp.]